MIERAICTTLMAQQANKSFLVQRFACLVAHSSNISDRAETCYEVSDFWMLGKELYKVGSIHTTATLKN